MPGRNDQFNTRLPDDLAQGVREYADDHDVSQSETVRRAVAHFLDHHDYPKQRELAADGGFLTTREHPWIEPLIQLGYDASRLSIYVMSLAFLGLAVPGGAIEWFGVTLAPQTAALFLSFFLIMLFAAGVSAAITLGALLVLEYLMHPSEAPFRRYFYDYHYPNGEIPA